MYQGKPLPKRVLRPFSYDAFVKLDKDEYVLLSNSNKFLILNSFAFLGYAIAAIVLIAWAVTDTSDLKKFYVALVIICISFIMHITSKYIKPTRYNIFNRRKGFISIPKGIFSEKLIEGPWEDWTARLTFNISSVGAPRHGLSLIHIPSRYSMQLDTNPGGYDYLLGHWSFIVQYMSGGPLPNVPELDDQNNLTNGLGSWEQWEKVGKYERDPYEEWLQQLKADPSLDVAYRDF